MRMLSSKKRIQEEHQRTCSNWMSLTGPDVVGSSLTSSIIASLDIQVFVRESAKGKVCSFVLSHVQWRWDFSPHALSPVSVSHQFKFPFCLHHWRILFSVGPSDKNMNTYLKASLFLVGVRYWVFGKTIPTLKLHLWRSRCLGHRRKTFESS